MTAGRVAIAAFTVGCESGSTTCHLVYYMLSIGGPGSSVRIATEYGLDGLGSNPSGDQIYRPSRPALGPTQSPVKWVLGLSRG